MSRWTENDTLQGTLRLEKDFHLCKITLDAATGREQKQRERRFVMQ
jgi:hypothetical protein